MLCYWMFEADKLGAKFKSGEFQAANVNELALLLMMSRLQITLLSHLSCL